MSKERYDYIDIAKGLGILMVVWAHIMITGWTHKVIYAFHMPLFFLISGMLFQREKYPSFGVFIKRRAKRLLIPYTIYSVLTWVFWAAFRYLRHDEVESYLTPLFQTFYAQGSGAYMVHNSALWFVPCLFLTEILYFFLCRLGKWECLMACFVCAGMSFELGNVYGDSYWFLLPWNADAALIALPFYCIGNMLTRGIGHERMVSSVSNYWGWYLLVYVIITFLLLWSALSYGECSMGSSSYQCKAWVFMSRAFIGCAWLVCLSLLIGSMNIGNMIMSTFVRYLKWAGTNSLDIMCLHIPVKGVCMIGVAAALHITVEHVGSYESYSFLAFVLTMLIVWLLIRFVPVSTLANRLLYNENKTRQ